MDLVCLLEPLHAEGDDGAPRGRRLAELQLGNGPELPAVLVAPGPMQQQVFDGADLQPRQLRRAFRADAGQHRHWSGQGRDRLIWASRRSSAGTIRCEAEIRSPKSEAISADAVHISNTVISGRQLNRIGTGNQPMPGLT